MNKTVMICLEKLGIGGVETYVFNQAIAFKNKGFSVIVLAEEGQYAKQLRNNNITVFNISFILENKINIDKVNMIMKIIEENNVSEVHIHQFPCILTVMFACILKDIPFVSYLHSAIIESYTWYVYNYPIYSKLFNMYFYYADKIIGTCKESINTHKAFSLIDCNDKYLILPNSILFENTSIAPISSTIKKFSIISRFSPEKLVSIYNAINLFNHIYSKCPNSDLSLDIIGDGPSKNNIEKYINHNDFYNIKICPPSYDIYKTINNYDVIIGMGRCILECIASKKIAIVSGYKNISGIVLPDNIVHFSEHNFTDRCPISIKPEFIIDKLINLSNQDINKTVEFNYNYIYEHFNIENNLYTINDN